jgi:hypothetical protein
VKCCAGEEARQPRERKSLLQTTVCKLRLQLRDSGTGFLFPHGCESHLCGRHVATSRCHSLRSKPVVGFLFFMLWEWCAFGVNKLVSGVKPKELPNVLVCTHSFSGARVAQGREQHSRLNAGGGGGGGGGDLPKCRTFPSKVTRGLHPTPPSNPGLAHRSHQEWTRTQGDLWTHGHPTPRRVR